MSQDSPSSGITPINRPPVVGQPQPQQPVAVTAIAPPGGSVTATASASPINPAPQQLAIAAFIFREIVALIFVLIWLVITGYDLIVSPDELVPFWFHLLGAGVLAYALGVNVATLIPTSGLSLSATPR